MSGWITITLDPVDEEEWALRFAEDGSEVLRQSTELSEEYEPVVKALARKLLTYEPIHTSGIDDPEVYGFHSYGKGASPEEILQDTADMWDRAVVIRANDTGGTGTATLFEEDGSGGLEEIDQYEENQCSCCGGRCGRIAAAYMLHEHHIGALADRYEHPQYSASSSEEIDAITY